MWQRGKHFLSRAGTLILGIVVIVWFLSSMPWGVEYASSESIMGSIGSFVAPIFDTAGFGQWQSSVSLLFGVAAKEVVVATMGTLFTVNGSMLGATLITQLGWTPLVAFSFMVFALLYTPCFATLMTIRSETNSWKWTIFSAVYPFVVAWIVATLIFQIGSLFI